jgi:hypothetical protein
MSTFFTARGLWAGAVLAVAGLMSFGASAATMTCSTSGPSGTTFSLTDATDSVCISGQNDAGAGGYFAGNPTVFGVSGWKLADKNDGGGDGVINFVTAPVNGAKSGSWSIDSLKGLSHVAIALKAGNGFGLFRINTLAGRWTSGKDLSHASVWYSGTPAAIPLPATGLLLIGALGGLGLARRRRKAA